MAPWQEDLGERQVKAPKVRLSDTGPLHAPLDRFDEVDLLGHSKVGATFEGFAIGERLRPLSAEPDEAYLCALHPGAELNLRVVRGRPRRGVQIEHTDSPVVTLSMRSAMEDLGHDRLDVVRVGDHTFPLAAGICAVANSRPREDVAPFRRRRGEPSPESLRPGPYR